MVIGEVVAGKYRVERLVGEGGMGIVVAARHLQLETVVALKLLPDAAANDPVLVKRFLREARAAAQLRSEHVARVLDVGTMESGAPYMVMEFLEGANLADVLMARGRLDPRTACDYVLQACEAVAEAHALGIVHRDLKPENLYLTTRVGGESLVKVIDFGVSKTTAVAGALTTTSDVFGSPMYMAPEQMRSSRGVDPRSDVWALGIVLYELLTERCPFEAESLPDLCVKIANEPHRPATDLRPGLPQDLVAIIERCLQKDPAGRFANAAELASALEPFAPAHARTEATNALRVMQSLGETLAESGTVSVTAPALAPSARRRRSISLAGLALAAAVVAGIWIAMRPAAGPPQLALAAVDAVRSASSFAQESASPPGTPVTLDPPPGTPVPARTGPASSPSHTPHITMMVRTLPRNASPASPRDDDIPAYR